LGGWLGLQGLVFFMIYSFGIILGLLASLVYSKTILKNRVESPFILELPPYRWPHWLPLIRKSMQNSWSFISKAGWIIFVCTGIVWFLGYFPKGNGNLGESWLASIGQYLEPITLQIGLDWKYGIAIISSFLAREVFVGTLGTMMGLEDSDVPITSLIDKVQASGLSLGSGLALLVFYAVAMQCISTLAMIKKELGSWKWPLAVLFIYSFLAALLAKLTYIIF
jgi:ferrous iron transport protein B